MEVTQVRLVLAGHVGRMEEMTNEQCEVIAKIGGLIQRIDVDHDFCRSVITYKINK